jgi:hypothetical protein
VKDIDNSHLWVGFTTLLAGLFCFPALDYFSAFDVEWETLFAALIALVAVYQVYQQRKNELERNKNHIRGKIVFAVSDGLSWLHDVMLYLYDLNHENNSEQNCPSHPKDIVIALSEAAKSVETSDVEHIVDICRKIQTIQSIIKEDRLKHPRFISERICSTYAILSHIFHFIDGENSVRIDHQNPIGKTHIEQAQIGLQQMFKKDDHSLKYRTYFLNLWGITQDKEI